MNIYIDFDGTLFDTSRFYNDFIKLCNKYNIDVEEIDDIRSHMEELFSLDNFALIIKDKYHLDSGFIDEVNSLYDSKYLYDDSTAFLENIYKNNNLYILSYREKNYQKKKINCCKLNKYFKDIIITDDKGSLDIDYRNGLFIDNNPREIEALSKAGASNIIRIKRKGDSYYDAFCDVKVKEYFALSDIDVL